MLQLSSITDRILRSCDFNIDVFLTEIDENLAASRAIFRNFDATFNIMSEEQWEEIQLKVVYYLVSGSRLSLKVIFISYIRQ